MKDNTQIKRRGLMLILSSPSGAGKTSISRAILGCDDNISLSVSVTTRPRRPGEVNGKDYVFVEHPDFDEMLRNKEFLESAKVFDHYYGTPRKPVEEALEKGMDVLFDIDWQGTMQLKEIAPEDLVTIFILPPSQAELESRLRKRAQDSDDVIALRMEKANDEMSHYTEYNYIVINKDFESTVDKVNSILKAERLKRRRLTGIYSFVKQLQDGV